MNIAHNELISQLIYPLNVHLDDTSSRFNPQKGHTLRKCT